MSEQQYTPQQIMFGLRDCLSEMLGTDEPFGFDTRIDHYLKKIGWWEEIDMSDVFFRIERNFGFRVARKRWYEFCGSGQNTLEEWEQTVGPRFTFGQLADFIALHAPPVPLHPIPVLGRNCGTAGVFQGMEQIVDSLKPKHKSFGPSTPIRDILSRFQQEKLWNRLRWMTQGKLPPTDESKIRGLLLGGLSIVLVLSGFASVICIILSLLQIATARTAGNLLLVSVAAAAGVWLIYPAIPHDIVTFRDLAERIASQEHDGSCPGHEQSS